MSRERKLKRENGRKGKGKGKGERKVERRTTGLTGGRTPTTTPPLEMAVTCFLGFSINFFFKESFFFNYLFIVFLYLFSPSFY